MSSFYRSNLYGGHEDEEDVPFDEMDMSGFLNGDTPRGDFEQPISEPAKPKVTARPRARTSSNASGTVGYVLPNPIANTEPDEPKLYHYASPFYADPDGIAPKAAAITKSIGVTGMVLSGTYAAAKRSDGEGQPDSCRNRGTYSNITACASTKVLFAPRKARHSDPSMSSFINVGVFP